MERQVAVKKMLVDGFGIENVEVGGIDDKIIVKVFRHGTFIIDADGNIKMPDDINPALADIIDLDLRSLDIMREEEVAYHPETFYVDGDW